MKAKYYLIILALLFMGIPGSWAKKKIADVDKILVINSYSPVREAGNHIISSFLEQIKEHEGIRIAVEYMDSEAIPDYTQWLDWMNSLSRAYDKPPKIVVIVGGEAWAAYKECHPENWQEIPVVLGGVKHGYIDYRRVSHESLPSIEDIPSIVSTFSGFHITGYYIEDYLKENIELAIKLQPGVKDIAFYYDDRYHHDFVKSYLESMIRQIGEIRLHYWKGSELSTNQLIDSIIGSNFPVISAGWFTDCNHYPHAYSKLHNELSRYPSEFLWQVLDQNFSQSTYLGGYFVSGSEIGSDLGKLTYTVLTRGIENSPAFQLTPSKPAYHLNYPVFVRVGLDKSNLPDSVVWHNVEPGLFEKYPVEMSLLFMLLSLAIVIGLLVFFYRRHREENYRKANQKMQHLLESMPDMAVIYDKDGKIMDIVNPLEDVLMTIRKEEVLGIKVEQVGEIVPEFRDSLDYIAGFIRLTLQTKKSFSFNYKIDYKDKICYAEAKTVPFDGDKVICFVHNATSRIMAEKEVMKYKNFLQTVIDNLPLGIFVKDVSNDYRYLYYNEGLVDFYGRKISDYIGKNDFEANDPLALQYQQEDFDVLKSDVPISYERELVNERGEEHWGITTKTKVKNNDGSYYIIAILVDTTLIRKKETELKNIRNELTIALEAGSLSAWLYDVKEKNFVSLYRETIAEQGMSYEEGLALLHPEDHGKYKVLLDDLVSGKYEKKTEIFRFYRNGKYSWYETHAMGFRDANTNEICQIVGTEKNITEELEKQRELEENRLKTELVINSNGITQWDYDLVTGMLSSPNKDSFLSQGVTGKAFFERVYPEDRKLLEEMQKKLVLGESESQNEQIRFYYPAENEYRWLDIHAIVFERDEKGKVTKITGLRQDITDKKRMTDELIRLRDKAEEANRLKTAFLANMSHEIRTPLNAIVGFSNLIAQTENPEEIKEYCHIIETNNELLLQLINDILDLSKIEAEQLEFVFSDISVPDIFNGLKQIYKLRVKEGVELVCDLPEGEYIIHSERNRLTQVVSNFLTNACKFTSEGSIKMGFTGFKNGLRFYVTDTGKGIAQENVPYVFDRFTKFDSFVQGTGLGLSICQTIIKRLGGDIGVESELGKGSTFWFTIPCEVKSSDPSIETERSPELVVPARSVSEKQQKCILIAEDNESNYFLVSSILKNDYLLERAVNGEEAVRMCRTLSPDLILMDIRMPEMDGLEATREIRKIDKEVPIIALTANAFDEDREKALKAGCNDYLSKPIPGEKLKETLKVYFES